MGATADTAIAAAGGGRGGSGGIEGTIASFTPGGRGTLPGQWGGAGKNGTGLDAGSSIIEQAGSNSSLRISLAGGGGGGGGRASNDNEYGGGDGGNAGQLAARTVPAGGTASGSPGEAGDANTSAPAGPGPGQGGGGGAGCTSNHASGQGGTGGLYGGGGGGSDGQNNGGTTKPGEAGLVIIECR